MQIFVVFSPSRDDLTIVILFMAPDKEINFV